MANNHSCPNGGSTVSCQLFEENEDQLAAVQNIRVVMSSLSFLGSLTVIVVIILLKKYAFMSSRLILYLSVSAFFSSVIYMVGRFTPDFSSPDTQDERFCAALGYFLLASDWMILLWFTIITVNLIINVILLKRTERLEIAYILVAIIVPLVIASIGFVSNENGVSFGMAGGWCWIRAVDVYNEKNPDFYCCFYEIGSILRFVLWYGPQIVLLLFLLVSNAVIVYKYIKKSRSWRGTYNPEIEYKKKLMREDVKPLLLYPIIYWMTQLFPLINRIAGIANPDASFLALYVLHVLTSPLAGVLVAIFYVILDKETRKRLSWTNLKASLKSWVSKNDVQEYKVEQHSYKRFGESSAVKSE